MVEKDLRKVSLILSSSLTTVTEAAVNLIPNISYRQLLNPIAIIISVSASVFITHKIKCYSCNLIIINNNEELKNCNDPERIKKLQDEITTLNRRKSKLDFLH
jgi:hypothetical protein